MASGSGMDADVAVIGGGVVGCAVANALAGRGAAIELLEAERELGLGASGTNSGILHTGFDSPAGELETLLILRAGELREPWLRRVERLGVPRLACGAELRPRGHDEEATVGEIAHAAARNGVEVELRKDGVMEIPDEGVTDPVAFTLALAGGATAAGADVLTGAPVEAIERDGEGLTLGHSGGARLRCRVAVNCAGLFADDVARLAGDESFGIYPRKGEFFVFDPPDAEPLDRILLPVPTERTKGVLVFPTVDGKVIAGPTAHDQEDKGDWSVRPDAAEEVLPKARAMLPALDDAEPIASYAGLRPAGRGVNYAIAPSQECPGLINVAAIRSTGLSASLGIGDYVADLVGDHGVDLTATGELPAPDGSVEYDGPWWLRTARVKVGA